MRFLNKNKIEIHYYFLVLAALILAFDPVVWLFHTWNDPSYDSKGMLVFLICVVMFFWGITSPLLNCRPIDKKKPFLLLFVSACVRLFGQIAAINVIGALTLVIDVYALSQITGLGKRKRFVSPFWLAVCFGFSLPLERIVQRSIGYGLQNLSADGACSILSTFYENVTCYGVRILINTQDVMVDLPCSGARSVLLLLFFYCCCAAVSRFNCVIAALGFGVTLLSALMMNIVRICVLAIGIGFPVAGIDVMDQPFHDLIGLSALALGAVPILFWVRRFSKKHKPVHHVLDQALWVVPRSVQRDGWWLESSPKPREKKASLALALLCVLGACVICNLPRKAMDVSRQDIPLNMPYSLNGVIGVPRSLSTAEKVYFTQYGGSAEKASYDDHGLMIVRTSAPLRHLHAPDECLRGLGMKVEYQGPDYKTIPSAIYKATDRDGNSYRIAVSFMSEDQSIITTNISEAVWRWMQNPDQSWTAVQRISPWNSPKKNNLIFDHAVVAALDISIEKPSLKIASIGEK